MPTAQEFFEALPSRVTPDRIEGMNNTYVFDIEGAGVWTVAVADGAITVTEGSSDADCTFSASEETFEKIASGEAERDHGVHDRQAQDQGRHGRRDGEPEDLLAP